VVIAGATAYVLALAAVGGVTFRRGALPDFTP
jgi:hypothetical protein